MTPEQLSLCHAYQACFGNGQAQAVFDDLDALAAGTPDPLVMAGVMKAINHIRRQCSRPRREKQLGMKAPTKRGA